MADIAKAKGYCLPLSSRNYHRPRLEYMVEEVSDSNVLSNFYRLTPVPPQAARNVSNTLDTTLRGFPITTLLKAMAKSDMSAPLPSRQVFLSKLKTVRLARLPKCCDGIATCSICFGDLADKAEKDSSERAIRLHGTHVFGELCIRKWLEENDSCPNCRMKVHAGTTDNDLVDDLRTQAGLLMGRRPTIDRPIVDLEVFKLYVRLWRGFHTVTSAVLAAQLDDDMLALMEWRIEWWEHNPLCLSLTSFSPYTRTQALRVEELQVPIVVHEQRDLQLLTRMVNAGLMRGVNTILHERPLHLGAHPLFPGMDNAIRRVIQKEQGKRMLVSALAISIRESIESDPQTKGLLTGEREDLPSGLQAYWEDFIVVFLRRLIESQDEQQ